MSGRGRIHAFTIHPTIQHHTSVGELREALPFITAIVELDEGPRLMSFIVDVEPDPAAIACDHPVEVVFLELDDGLALPAFRPASGPLVEVDEEGGGVVAQLTVVVENGVG